MLKKLLYIALVIGVGIITVVVLILKRTPARLDEGDTPTKTTIPYSAGFNYRQTVNDCGPFNTAAVVRALTNTEISPAQFAEEIGWRLPNNYTIPKGLEMQLKAHGLHVKVPHTQSLLDEQKITYLKQELSKGHPIIILGERDGFEHYVTLFGFSDSEFYVYDSFFDKDPAQPTHTMDANNDAPGNRTYSSEELLDFWRGGGMYGLYEWYSIVVSNDNL